jgi:Flp pilus assembly protein TadG
MMKLSFCQMRRLRREDGSIAVEFAIIFPILMLLVFGVIDFGHAWYMRHLMSDARP